MVVVTFNQENAPFASRGLLRDCEIFTDLRFQLYPLPLISLPLWRDRKIQLARINLSSLLWLWHSEGLIRAGLRHCGGFLPTNSIFGLPIFNNTVHKCWEPRRLRLPTNSKQHRLQWSCEPEYFGNMSRRMQLVGLVYNGFQMSHIRSNMQCYKC